MPCMTAPACTSCGHNQECVHIHTHLHSLRSIIAYKTPTGFFLSPDTS